MLSFQNELKDNGFVVLKSYYSQDEAADICKRLQEDENFTPFSDIMFEIRERVKPLFSITWKTDSLVTSFDGACIRTEGTVDSGLEWHIDSGRRNDPNRMCCIQGLVAFTDVTEESGGTSFLPRSHKYNEELSMRVDPNGEEDCWEFFSVSEKDPVFKKCNPPVFPLLKRGDVLLWDSRTVHKVLPTRPPHSERVAAYVCFSPSSECPPSIRRKRKRAVSEGISTTHWPTKFVDRGDERRGGRSLRSLHPQWRSYI
jgi:hypothetical protein